LRASPDKPYHPRKQTIRAGGNATKNTIAKVFIEERQMLRFPVVDQMGKREEGGGGRQLRSDRALIVLGCHRWKKSVQQRRTER
jgi:hypothetical protein